MGVRNVRYGVREAAIAASGRERSVHAWRLTGRPRAAPVWDTRHSASCGVGERRRVPRPWALSAVPLMGRALRLLCLSTRRALRLVAVGCPAAAPATPWRRR